MLSETYEHGGIDLTNVIGRAQCLKGAGHDADLQGISCTIPNEFNVALDQARLLHPVSGDLPSQYC